MENSAQRMGLSGFFDLEKIDLLPSLILYDTNMQVEVYVPPQWVGNDNQNIYIFYDGVKQFPPGYLFNVTTALNMTNNDNALYVANVGNGHLRQVNVGNLKGISMK